MLIRLGWVGSARGWEGYADAEQDFRGAEDGMVEAGII